ncbi:MAG TPA: alpha-L-fucosidase [Opitutaceae bacterium]|nr:alpha-L-fucosidase [Opitutaceae bacterium]
MKSTLIILWSTFAALRLCAAEAPQFSSTISAAAEPVAPGKFQPSWDSLRQYEVPEWFRNAKFGIWAHWGPQCQPEQGDWYARAMYQEGSDDNKYHVEHYGPPSAFGFKDVINTWRAERWDPDRLVALYKRVGAQYFFALANHHDNLDLWDSKYQPWNSVRVGPKKDIIAGWAKAARAQGLPFGVSVHAAHAWIWYEPAQGADKAGPFAGAAYDGRLTQAEGRGRWWDGLDPQALYAQHHARSVNSEIPSGINDQWAWGNGASIPDAAYCEKFYNRTIDLINRYHPDLVYFDDTVLPLWPVSDAGLRIAAHFYNSNMRLHNGRLEGVMLGKILNEEQRRCLVWDIERGASNRTEPLPWQTDTCIGDWHYRRSIYERDAYKSAKTVVQMLADIVSKNGNLLLNIPVRGDGTIDDREEKVLEGIAGWMDVNRECIFGTRPWKVFGEGPASEGAALSAQGFNEGKGKSFTAEDVRFTEKAGALYAIVMGWPEKPLAIRSLGGSAKLLDRAVAGVELLGSDESIRWTRDDGALVLEPAKGRPASDFAVVYKIKLQPDSRLAAAAE